MAWSQNHPQGQADRTVAFRQGLRTYSVTTLSGLSDSEVRCAYKLCSLFIFPSSYDGFGIPILEAMAAHYPIVLSDIPVFREITEEQGIYFPYDNVEAMVFAIETVFFQVVKPLAW